MIDSEGGLIDWDEGFESEFSVVSDYIAMGRGWADLIAMARDREGFLRDGSRDAIGDGKRGYEYRALNQIIHIAEAHLVGGGWCRIAQDVTRESENASSSRKSRQGEKDQAVGRLTSGIAHDFNNLLMVTLSNAESILADAAPGSATVKYATAIKRAVDRGTDLTRQLLALTRQQPLAPRTIDVMRLFDEFPDVVARSFGGDIRIELTAADDIWAASADPSKLEAALLNLVADARDAMPEGGVIKLRVANETVAHGGAEELPAGDYVVLSVENTGFGRTADTQGKVCESSVMSENPAEGTGLGLGLVYGFARQSGGVLQIDSAEGRGTKVRLYLPRGAPSALEAPGSSPPLCPAERRYTILLVDDHDLVRTAVTANLESLNYRVLTADRGPAAMVLLEGQEPIDLLFTDVVMPGGFSGAEVARRARELRPSIKVLFTSGFTSSSLVQNGRLEPGVELLMKPYDLSELVATLKRILEP
ncbi:MAG: response regulator [Steroidobacteraceae bacterium]|jgi:signal transduction histidine kinase